MTLKRSLALLLLLSLLLSTAGCSSSESTVVQTKPGSVIATPEPVLTTDPAPVLSGVETDHKVVSLIFEGYTDSTTMDAIAEVLKSKGVNATFFVSGITANENPQVIKRLASRGFAVGSYGMSGGKHLEKLSAYENARRFELAQKEIETACGRRPTLIRCNGTVYTEDVLRAVTAAGLSAAVEPTAYINHKSFRTAEDAETFALGLLRGSILSVKLGQELDADEYGDPGSKLDERPAIDPLPGIRWEWSTEEEKYALLPDIVEWLVDTLQSLGYSFTDPVSLQGEKHALLRRIRELDENELRELDPENYELPVTDAALSAGGTRKAAAGDFNGAVFVGDSVMAGLASYVDWQRQTDRKFLDDARFLTEDQLTVEKLVEGQAELGDLAEKLADMKAKSVWLCLGFTSQRAYRKDAYLAKYRLLIKQIQEKNPGIQIVVMSVLPKLGGFGGVSNGSRFSLNLMLCGMCREYGFAFSDAASAVRDETGQLREEYCLDRTMRGSHLNDAGCAAVLDFIMEKYPV